MKTKNKLSTVIFFFSLCVRGTLLAQNITNTLGTNGQFTIKNGSNTFLSLHQSIGDLVLIKSLDLPDLTPSAQIGIIKMGGIRFIHAYQRTGTDGYNTFVGYQSGSFGLNGSGTGSSYNTGMGASVLLSLSSGQSNSAFGSNSMINNNTGSYNSAFGDRSLYSNNSGSNNCAFGYMSQSNSNAGNNSTFGYQTLVVNNNGNNNCAFGYQSQYNNWTNFNSSFGTQSLFSSILGTSNSAFGYRSLYSSLGAGNSALGSQSLLNTTGDNNSALGNNAGSNITTGSNNLTLGNNSQVPTGTANNQVRIGNTSITYAGVQVAWTITSDRRWKSNILNSNLGLSFINKLRPVSYTRSNDESQKTEYGFIAQEVEETLKEEEVNNTGMLTVDDNGMYEMRYNDLLAPMVKAIQELKSENDELKKRLGEYENNQTILMNEINKVKQEKSVNSKTVNNKTGEN